MANPDAVVVATNAFGMGINKPEHPLCRTLQHSGQPGSVLPGGQAARGAMAAPRNAFSYVSLVDRHTQEFFIDKIGENNTALTAPQVELLQAHARQKLERMFQYACTPGAAAAAPSWPTSATTPQ